MSFGNSSRALVVDDDEITLALISYRLQVEGFNVDWECDGAAAIERLKTGTYTVLVLDILMPRLDGFGVMQWLNEHAPHLRSHVIIVTATSLNLEGVFRVMSKPVDFAELAAAVHECDEQSSIAGSPSWYSPASARRPVA